MADDEPCHVVEVDDPENPGGTLQVPLPLSETQDAVAEFLEQAGVHYRVWLETAVFYRKHGKEDKYTDLLERAMALMNMKQPRDALDRDRRCEVYCSLAGHYLNRYAEDSGSKEDYNTFTNLVAQARRQDPDHAWVAILQQMGELLSTYYSAKTPAEKKAAYGTVERKLDILKGRCKTTTQKVQANMGLAMCRYFMNDYVSAWKDFADLLAMTPGSTPYMVRLGLGYCNYKLGQTNGAIKAFQRAVEERPTERRPLLGLASILMGYQGSEEDAVEKQRAAADHLTTAFRTNPEDPVLLNLFASYLFRELYANPEANAGLAKQIEKVTTKVSQLAKKKLKELKAADRTASVEYAQAQDTLAEASFQHGRLAQLQNKFPAAAKQYETCLTHNPKHIPAMFNHAQCLIRNKLVTLKPGAAVPLKHVEEVLSLLKRCSRMCPENADLLSVVSKLNAWKGITATEPEVQEEAMQEALAALNTITEVADPLDPDAWMLRGYVERSDMAESLRCLQRQVHVLQETEKKVPAMLYSNVAALQIELRDMSGASATLQKADEALEAELAADASLADTEEYESLRSTMMYNRALFEELAHNLQKSAAHQLQIIKENPDFVDAYIALAENYYSMGRCRLAVATAEMCATVLRTQPLTKQVLPRLYLAELYFRMHLLKESIALARETREQLENGTTAEERESHAVRELIGFARMIEANGRYAVSATASTSSALAREELAMARSMFEEIHQADPDNAVAVHNIACATASACHFKRNARGELPDKYQSVAKTLIERVKEASVPAGSTLEAVATYNLAQLHYYQRQPGLAIPLYLALQSRAETEPHLRNVVPVDDLPQKLAHCYALKRDFRASVRGFSKLVEEQPMSVTTNANMAMATVGSVLQDYNDDKLQTPEMLDTALGQLSTARGYIMRLINDLDAGCRDGGLPKQQEEKLRARLGPLHKQLKLCDDATVLLEEEAEGMRRTIVHVEENVKAFSRHAEELVGWKEAQRAQEEADRRRAQEERQKRMEEQEARLQQVQAEWQAAQLDVPPDSTMALPTVRGPARRGRAADDGMGPATLADVDTYVDPLDALGEIESIEREPGRKEKKKKKKEKKEKRDRRAADDAMGGLGDELAENDAFFADLEKDMEGDVAGTAVDPEAAALAADIVPGSTSDPTYERTQRKRKLQDVTQETYDQIKAIEDEGSDYTDDEAMALDDDGASDFDGSIDSSDDGGPAKKKQKLNTRDAAVAKKEKKEKKGKKEKKEKKEKKGKKEKKADAPAPAADDDDDLEADF